MQSTTHVREGWSRRHFLLLGLSVPALQAMPALARGRSPLAPTGSARGGATRTLIVVSAEHLTPTLRNSEACVLAGDRLARLDSARRLLRHPPAQVRLHLDATDRLLWDVALAEAGVTPLAIDGTTQRLVHRHGGSVVPAKEARA